MLTLTLSVNRPRECLISFSTFFKQEQVRFANPHRAFTYHMHQYESVVGPVKGVYNKDSSMNKAREHAILVKERPSYVTILTLGTWKEFQNTYFLSISCYRPSIWKKDNYISPYFLVLLMYLFCILFGSGSVGISNYAADRVTCCIL